MRKSGVVAVVGKEEDGGSGRALAGWGRVGTSGDSSSSNNSSSFLILLVFSCAFGRIMQKKAKRLPCSVSTASTLCSSSLHMHVDLGLISV